MLGNIEGTSKEVATKHTTIVLNGKRYDARTGKLLSAHESVTIDNKTVVKPVGQQGVSMDGVNKKPMRLQPIRQQVTAKTVHAKTTKSQTLMRTAVKKPASLQTKKAPKPTVQRRSTTRHSIDPKKVTRSQAIPKSTLVSRFGAPITAAIKPKTEVLPVKPAPEHEPAFPFAQQIEQIEQAVSPAIEQFQNIINDATSHTQQQIKKLTRRQKLSKKLNISTRTLNLAAASLSAVLLIGFIAYQNVPNLSMQVATARSGVQGSLPNYQPAGFGMKGPIQYQQGQIVINFKSHTDNRAFQVTQNASQWNSDTLLENYVANDGRSYQTVQQNGKTIYIYDDNATWVDGGVWYRIEGESALNSDQLLRLASSL